MEHNGEQHLGRAGGGIPRLSEEGKEPERFWGVITNNDVLKEQCDGSTGTCFGAAAVCGLRLVRRAGKSERGWKCVWN